MQIAILTFEGFNEIDSFVALNILNRVKQDDWRAYIASPTPTVTSMNGVTIHAQQPLEFANEADAVLIGSGRQTRQLIQDSALMARIRLDPQHQLIGSQCSGALMLKTLGLVETLPVCTDATTRPALEALGANVLDKAFHAEGNLATAGGCLSAQYLASWLIWRALGWEAAAHALSYTAPVGETESLIARAREIVTGKNGN
jgi:transcriptional regulator GlxA family with amidase domain